MLDRLRKHLQTWLDVPSDMTPQLTQLQARMATLEMMPSKPPDPPDRRTMSAVPDAHLGAH